MKVLSLRKGTSSPPGRKKRGSLNSRNGRDDVHFSQGRRKNSKSIGIFKWLLIRYRIIQLDSSYPTLGWRIFKKKDKISGFHFEILKF